MLNENKNAFNNTKTKPEFLIESSKEAEIKIGSLVLGKIECLSEHIYKSCRITSVSESKKNCMQNNSQLFTNRFVQRLKCEST